MAGTEEGKIYGGYFIISKLIFDSAIWRDDPSLLKLFIYIIGKAWYGNEPLKFANGIVVNRGEIVTSLDIISTANEYMENNAIKRWSRTKVSRMLKKLQEDGYISIACDTYGTHIKVCNYEKYQNVKLYACNADETKKKRSRNAVVTQVDIYNEVNKDIIPPIVPQTGDEHGSSDVAIESLQNDVMNLALEKEELLQKVSVLERELSKKKRKAKVESPDFIRFFENYPRHRQVKRGSALEEWNKNRDVLPPIEELLLILGRHKQKKSWLKDDGKYVETPTKWLKAKCWKDVIPEGEIFHEKFVSPYEQGIEP